MKNHKLLFSVLLLLLSTFTAAQAAINFGVDWDFDGGTGVDLTSTQLFDTSGYNLVPSAAVVSSAWHSSVMGSSWAPSLDAYNPGDYFEFTVSADPATTIQVDSFSFRQTGAGGGTALTWELRSNVDGYGSVLASDNVSSISSGKLETASSLGLASAGNSITLRVYGQGGGPNQFAGFAIADVSMSGTVVPEASLFSLVGGISGLWLVL